MIDQNPEQFSIYLSPFQIPPIVVMTNRIKNPTLAFVLLEYGGRGGRGVVADHFNQDSWRCDLTPKYQLSMFVSCNLHVMTKPAANFTPLLRPIGEISVIDRKNMNHWRSAHLFIAPYIESP